MIAWNQPNLAQTTRFIGDCFMEIFSFCSYTALKPIVELAYKLSNNISII